MHVVVFLVRDGSLKEAAVAVIWLDMCTPVICVCPAHISLVICVPPVGIQKTLKLCTRAFQGLKKNMESRRDRFCGFLF